jgi:hypothetical protein
MQMLVKGIEAWSEITNRYTHHGACFKAKWALFACCGDLEPDNRPLNLIFNSLQEAQNHLQEVKEKLGVMDGAIGWSMEERRASGE